MVFIRAAALLPLLLVHGSGASELNIRLGGRATGATIVATSFVGGAFLLEAIFAYVKLRTGIDEERAVRERPGGRTNILLLGDSLDRHVVEALNSQGMCSNFSRWTDKLHYDTGMLRCVAEDGHSSISNLHLFSVAPHGPYHEPIPGEPHEDTGSMLETPSPVCFALREFASNVRLPPTLVVFQSLHWNLGQMPGHPWYRPAGPAERGKNVTWWKTQFRLCIADIMRCKDPATKVALRTVPRTPSLEPFVREMNDFIRSLIDMEGVVKVFDYDRLIWSDTLVPDRCTDCEGILSVGQWTLADLASDGVDLPRRRRNCSSHVCPLRDGVHPTVEYAAAFGKFLLDAPPL